MTSVLAKTTTPLRDAVSKAWDHFEGLSAVKDRDSWFQATAGAGLSANIAEDDKVHRLGEKIEKAVRTAERQSRTWRSAYNLSEAGKIELDGKRLAKDMGKTLAKIEGTQKDLLKIKQLTSDDLLLGEVDHALSTMKPTIQAFTAAIKMGQRGLKMSTLQKDLIKLAYDKPHFRAKILPILERAAATKTASQGPNSTGRGWLGSLSPTRWLWSDKTSGVSFTVTEKKGPGQPIFTLQVLTDNGVFKHVKPSQWKDKKDAFKAAAKWYKALAAEEVSKDLRTNWSKTADVQKTAINQDTQDFIDWIYTTRQGQPLGTSEVVTALKKAGVVQKAPKKKRSGPRYRVGDEVIVNFKKAKADPRFYPAMVGGPTGTPLDDKAWKKLDGKVGKVTQAGTGVSAKFGSTEIWMAWGQENRGIPLYKYFPPTVIEAKSPKLEIVYLAGGQAKEEAKLTVTNYLARGSQRGQQRPAYYYTGYSYGWRIGRNGPYFEVLAQQRFQFNPDKVGDKLGQGGYAPRSFNPAIGQVLYLGVFNSRPTGWKSDVESWKAEASGE